MSIALLTIDDKTDSAEKQAQTANIPATQKVMAQEFNQVKNKTNEIVAEVNKKSDDINAVAAGAYPTTATVKTELDKKIDKAIMGELEVSTATQANNLATGGKGCLSFTNAIEVTGINTTGFYDGQQVLIYNKSAGQLTVKHLSTASSAGNRIYMASGASLSLKPNSFVALRYSAVRTRLEVVNIHGTDYLFSLANNGTQAKAVTVTPEGVILGEDIMEFEVIDSTVSGFASLSAVAAAYSTEAGYKKGFQVICPFMPQPTIYKKCGDGDDVWLKIDTQVTKMT